MAKILPRPEAWLYKSVSFFVLWPAMAVLMTLCFFPLLLTAWLIIPWTTLYREEDGKITTKFPWGSDDE